MQNIFKIINDTNPEALNYNHRICECCELDSHEECCITVDDCPCERCVDAITNTCACNECLTPVD